MDELQIYFYNQKFLLEFFRKKGMDFQNWFVQIAGFAFGSDFEKVRPYGSKGDKKCDGYRVSTKTVFQCYAPDSMKEQELIKKIDEDFNGAVSHWKDMQSWVFVHNDNRGLTSDTVQYLDTLRKKHPSIKIETWSDSELSKLTMRLELSALQTIFGYAPSLAVTNSLVLSDLEPVIESLSRLEPDQSNVPLAPPSSTKLSKNKLPEMAKTYLSMGRNRSALVREFFDKNPKPDLGERIAEAFRQRYGELKELNFSVENIFWKLQQGAGFNGELKHQDAALAVLAYFFDSCDIFEDPDTPEDIS